MTVRVGEGAGVAPGLLPGLGDEAYMSESLGRASVRWRRDGFSVHLRDFPVEDVVAIAHEIDGQMPAA